MADTKSGTCTACGRPFSPTHDVDAPGPTVRHPFIPMLTDPAVHNARRSRALAVVRRLTGSLQTFIEHSADPGSEACGAVWEGNEFLRQGGGAALASGGTAEVITTCPHCGDGFTAEDIADGDVAVVCAMCAKAGRLASGGTEPRPDMYEPAPDADEDPDGGPAYFADLVRRFGRCTCDRVDDGMGGSFGECTGEDRKGCVVCKRLDPDWPCPTTEHTGYEQATAAAMASGGVARCLRESVTPSDDGTLTIDCSVHGEVAVIRTGGGVNRMADGEGEAIETVWAAHLAAASGGIEAAAPWDVARVCGDSTGPNGVGGPCVLPPNHPHVDGIGGQWAAVPASSGDTAAPATINSELRVGDLLRAVADGRREYAKTAPDDQARVLNTQATAFELAARIVGGDYKPLYGLLPSWRWTTDMDAKLPGGGPLVAGDVAALAASRSPREETP